MPRGHNTVTRSYGPYRDSDGNRTHVTLRIFWDSKSGKTTALFEGEEYAKHSSHPYAVGQAQGSAPQALKDLWDRWHLNHMRAECAHQRDLGWSWETHPSENCPVCGYRLGSKWLFEKLPNDFLAQCDAAANVEVDAIECPRHEGNYDCTPFCELCEGEQEFTGELTDKQLSAIISKDIFGF